MLKGKFARKETRDGILFVVLAVLMSLFSVALVISASGPQIA